MRVLLTLYGEERPAQDFSPEEGEAEMAAWAEFDQAAREAGVLLACEVLAMSHTPASCLWVLIDMPPRASTGWLCASG